MVEGSASSSDVRSRVPNHVASDGGQHRRNRSKQSSHNSLSARPNSTNNTQLDAPSSRLSVYFGSYGRSPRPSFEADVGANSSSRASIGHLQFEHVLDNADAELHAYGVQELRDGFFDGSFIRPMRHDRAELMEKASESMPEFFQHHHPLSLRHSLSVQWHELVFYFKQITNSRSGIQLAKSFLGFFIAYLMCLVPAAENWLGTYSYIIALSTIINHPGRSIGSQIDGALSTTLGTVAGLAWGSLALYVSTSTATARSGYGGVLATFLVLFTASIAWLRCIYMRFYQAVICAGIAICYTCLANTSQAVGWSKIFDYGIPWVLGQALCLLVSFLVFPDTGSRSLAIALHGSLTALEEGLVLPRQDSIFLRRKLAWSFVDISQAVRDFTIDLSVSRFDPNDIRSVRNLIQGVIRGVLAIKPNTSLMDMADHLSELPSKESEPIDGHQSSVYDDLSLCQTSAADAIGLVSRVLGSPTRKLIGAMVEGISGCDATILNLAGHGEIVRSSRTDPYNLEQTLRCLKSAIDGFDLADTSLIGDSGLPSTYSKHPKLVELFLFVHPVRQTADRVQALLQKILQMQQRKRGWTINLPSYPLSKALIRTNAQVRHDRGGLTAGFYFRSKGQLEKTMQDLQSKVYIPITHHPVPGRGAEADMPSNSKYREEQKIALAAAHEISDHLKSRYQLWQILHRMQGFESRFAFKVTLVTTLLSIPAWLPQSRDWWNTNESWWAVVTVWVMMHPRVGGNFQDLATRSLYAAIGAIWAGLADASDHGNPYVMAIFAALFMLPMMHRFTQSSHPRSGIVGCISFTVISLSAYKNDGKPSIVDFTWTRGLAFVVGVVSAVLVNWVLWPFVARHELRKSLSAMMLHSALIYRGVVAKYIYYNPGEEPGPQDVARSEALEGRLREGFVRIRQLMELTQHEIRLRAPFDPLPYNAVIDSCERFFEHLVEVRQSSLYFQPHMLASGPAAASALISERRDAVAVILMNIYILACALRSNRPVPRYLPSAAAARRKLLDRMEVVEGGEVQVGTTGRGRRWADVYQYAFSGALTEVVEEVQVLQLFTREITGEVGFDPPSQI